MIVQGYLPFPCPTMISIKLGLPNPHPSAAPPSSVSVEVPIDASPSLWPCHKLVPNHCHLLPQYHWFILQCRTSYVWVKVPTDV